MNEHNENDKLRVLLLRPGELAEIAEIEDNLESMQSLVEGNIEEYMPFEDASDPRVGDCAIVCNEEGKMLGMELNRGIFDQNGRLQEIIAGPFFICYAPVESEKFLSMPPDLEEKMRKKIRTSGAVLCNGKRDQVEEISSNEAREKTVHGKVGCCA
ncbi:DUF3846 domain-containing protein [Baileyella intestinalis]|uniref:DUF3846 domain-containing protein n=1 Tax=Baileyella intestinalis TaxID=2606709 RepID=UPI0022E1F2AF|nr:DUF3846 domain-containing protein [Baileyella intestinalis]